MKLASDIKILLEEDTKKLTEAFLTGEIKLPLPEMADQADVHSLSAEIIRFQLERRMASAILPYLSTMKWLSLDEACIYSRKSRNTMLDLIKEGKIYGTKAEGGEWIVDRESIDAYYNEERLALQEKLKHLRRAS